MTETLSQVSYTTQGGDTLPSVAEACGHSGEWPAILAVNPWIPEGGDYLNVPPGSSVLLPGGWVPAGWERPQDAQSELASGVDLNTLTAAELVQLAGDAATLAQLDAIDAASKGRVTVQDAVYARRQVLLDQGVSA